MKILLHLRLYAVYVTKRYLVHIVTLTRSDFDGILLKNLKVLLVLVLKFKVTTWTFGLFSTWKDFDKIRKFWLS